MARKPAKCGTEGGYRRHSHFKEPHCEPCKEAHNERMRQQRAVRSKRDKKKKAEERDQAIRTIKKTVSYSLEDIDEIADLIYQRNTLRDSIEVLKTTEPARIAALSKELREVHKRVNELLEIETEKTEEATNDIFSGISISLSKTP